MIVVGLLAALVIIFLAGFGVALSILARGDRVNPVECACLGWLFGCGTVSLLLWICGMFCSGLVLQMIVAVCCLALAIFGWRTKRIANSRFDLPKPANIIEWILGSIVVLEIAALIFVSFKHTLGWDGLLNWEIKARYAFLSGGSIPAAYYSSAGRVFSHPEYPLTIPFTELWLYLWMGESNQFWVKIIFPLFYAACAPLLALLVFRLSGKRWVGLLIAALLPFVPSAVANPGSVVVGYVDIPLSAYYLAAVGYLLLWFRTGDLRFIMVFGAASAFLPWTKTEGIILWGVFVFIGFILSLAKQRLRQFLVSIVPGTILIIAWRIYLRLVHMWPHSDFESPGFDAIRHNLGRLGNIFGILFAELTERAHWSIFWFIAVIALIYLFASRKLEKIALALTIIIPAVVYSLIYILSSWPSWTAHMTSSFPRLLLHVMPPAWLAIGLALSQARREAQPL
ncbi:MAG TPA: hypothetical protein VKS98_11115 [Chthoniobacterales bacterium]|nr:hypothetical protein [Chthoniobacterales bacterium]